MISRRYGFAFWLVFAAGLIASGAAEPGDARDAASARSPREVQASVDQAKPSERGREDRSSSKQIGSAPRPDPFEPFLRDWVSPRHRIQQTPVPGVAGSTPPLVRSSVPESSAAVPNAARSANSATNEGNPYLKAMATPPPVGATSAQSPLPASAALETRAAGEEGRAVQPTLTAPEGPVRAPSTGYRPPPAKDAKYFPQQKRF